MKRALYLVLCFAISSVFSTVNAQVAIVTSAPTAGDTLVWSVVGPNGTAVSNPFTATSTGGITVTGSFAGSGGGQQIVQQGSSWGGNFSLNDYVLWTNHNGPLTLAFNQGVSLAGAQIQADYFGAFEAQIQAFDGTTLLGTFTENGNSNSNGDGSAIFMGIQDLSGAQITSITLSLLNASTDPNDFGIDTLYLNGTSSVTPEPTSNLMFATGLLGIALITRRMLVH